MSKFFRAVLLAGLLSSFAFAQTDYDHVDWEKFNENIKIALKSENPGLKFSAMLNIIKYSDYLNVSNRGSAIEVMREFKNNEDVKLRRLSVITLYKMKNDWAMDSLKRRYKFEENARIKNAIAAVVLAYESDNKKTAAM